MTLVSAGCARLAKALLQGALLVFGCHACAKDAPDTRALIGTWDVKQVAVDKLDQPHWLYFPEDPRLLGRELHITSAELALNEGSVPCQVKGWTRSTGSLQQRVGKTFPRPPGPDTPAQPTLADFGLPSPAADVVFHVMQCTQQKQPWNEAWIATLPAGQLLMHYGAGVLLLLTRQASPAVPMPSYDCTRVHTEAERAICGSPALAAFDRSVAAAYERAGSTGDAVALKSEQADWLKTRDACGKDGECLTRTMRERVEELMQ